jgi:hypothetical protein
MDFDQEISRTKMCSSRKRKGMVKTMMVLDPGYLKTRMEGAGVQLPLQAKPDLTTPPRHGPLGAPVISRPTRLP